MSLILSKRATYNFWRLLVRPAQPLFLSQRQRYASFIHSKKPKDAQLASRRPPSSERLVKSAGDVKEWRKPIGPSSKFQGEKSTPSSTPRHLKYFAKDPFLLEQEVQRMAGRGELNAAIEMVKNSRSQGQSVVVWNRIIEECAKAKRYNLAYKMFLELKRRGFKPNGQTYIYLLSALEKAEHVPDVGEKAKNIYRNMIVPSQELSIAHTNAFINIIARHGDYNEAMKIFSEMPRSGPQRPDKITFMTMINASSWRRGDEGFMGVMSIWEQLTKFIIREIEDNRKPYLPQERPDPLWQPLAFDEPMILGVLNGCAHAENHQKIAKGFEIVESLYGLHPPSLAKVKSYSPPTTSIRGILGEEYGNLIAPLSPSIANKVLTLCFRIYHYRLGREYIDEFLGVPEFKPDIELFNSLIQLNLQIDKSNRDQWVELAEDTIALLKTIRSRHLRPNMDTYRRILYACTRLPPGRAWTKCKEVIEDLEEEERWTAKQKFTPDRRVYLDIKCCLSVIKCARFSPAEDKVKVIPQAIKILRDANWLQQLKTLSVDSIMKRVRKIKEGEGLLGWAIELTDETIKELEYLIATPRMDDKQRERYERELKDARDMKVILETLPRSGEESKSESKKAGKDAESDKASTSGSERNRVSASTTTPRRDDELGDKKWKDSPRRSLIREGERAQRSYMEDGRNDFQGGRLGPSRFENEWEGEEDLEGEWEERRPFRPIATRRRDASIKADGGYRATTRGGRDTALRGKDSSRSSSSNRQNGSRGRSSLRSRS